MENEIYYSKGYEDLKNEIREEMSKTVNSFVRIGYLLKVARDTNILAESRYNNMEEFAYAEFKIDKGTASKFMNINDRFSEGGNSDHLKPEYSGIGWSKLSVMLQLPDSINEELNDNFTKTEIKVIRDEVAEAKQETPLETIMEGETVVTAAAPAMIYKVIRQLGESNPDIYTAIHAAIKKNYDYDLEDIKSIMAPAGEMIYSIRIRGVGRIMLSVKDYEEDVSLINERTGEKEKKTWDDLAVAWIQIIEKAKSPEENWEEVYEQKFPKSEVAPVQQKKEPKVTKVNQKPKKQQSKEIPKNEPQEKVGREPEEVPENRESESIPNKEQTLHDVEPSIPEPDPIPEPEHVSVEDVEVIEPEIPGQDTVENHSEWMPDKKEDVQQSEEEIRAAVTEELEALNDFWNGQYSRKAELMLDALEELKKNLEKLRENRGNENEI